MLPSLEWLKEEAKTIHFFGLGFIQVKITDKVRYHFYHPDLPRITPEEEIHNHRYTFTSGVIKGCLKQELYFPELETNKTDHELSMVSCDPKKPAPAHVSFCEPLKLMESYHTSGMKYTITPHAFHRVAALGYTITKIYRGSTQHDFALVIRKKGAESVCPFSKQISSDTLWDYIKEMLK